MDSVRGVGFNFTAEEKRRSELRRLPNQPPDRQGAVALFNFVNARNLVIAGRTINVTWNNNRTPVQTDLPSTASRVLEILGPVEVVNFHRLSRFLEANIVFQTQDVTVAQVARKALRAEWPGLHIRWETDPMSVSINRVPNIQSNMPPRPELEAAPAPSGSVSSVGDLITFSSEDEDGFGEEAYGSDAGEVVDVHKLNHCFEANLKYQIQDITVLKEDKEERLIRWTFYSFRAQAQVARKALRAEWPGLHIRWGIDPMAVSVNMVPTAMSTMLPLFPQQRAPVAAIEASHATAGDLITFDSDVEEEADSVEANFRVQVQVARKVRAEWPGLYIRWGIDLMTIPINMVPAIQSTMPAPSEQQDLMAPSDPGDNHSIGDLITFSSDAESNAGSDIYGV
ncbi:hypothetical protein N0V85_002148 [Neurospora sp. IMI 360204]|nr:hypothetical protein N0V85_002148 [Neurospora sp. IMI 360204]